MKTLRILLIPFAIAAACLLLMNGCATAPQAVPELPDQGLFDPEVIPVDWSGSGYATFGVPFDEGAAFTVGWAGVDEEVAARWPDGSVKVALVTAPSRMRRLRPGPDRAPFVAPGYPSFALFLNGEPADVQLSVLERGVVRTRSVGQRAWPDGLVVRVIHDAFPDGSNTRVTVRNTTPTATNSAGTQPILEYGAASDRDVHLSFAGAAVVRWAAEMGVDGGVLWDLPLRAGEQKTFELGQSWPRAQVSAERWQPVIPWPAAASEIYDAQLAGIIEGFYERQAQFTGQRNPRDFGDFSRDFEGPPSPVKFHNNEYGVLRGLAMQALRYGSDVAWDLGEAHARHTVDIDVYHVQAGPLPWMYGMPFQHTEHGGSGWGREHRSVFSPNPNHFCAGGVLDWYYLTGDPVILDTWDFLFESAAWKVENGPGMPGLSDTTGEKRIGAYLLEVLLDELERTNSERARAAAARVVEESTSNAWLHGDLSGEWRMKPWQLALLVIQLDRAAEHGIAGATDALLRASDFLAEHGVVDDPTWPHLWYELSTIPDRPSSDEDMIGFWSVVAADALMPTRPELAARLFDSGIRSVWYPGHPVGEWPRLLSATGILAHGLEVLR